MMSSNIDCALTSPGLNADPALHHVSVANNILILMTCNDPPENIDDGTSEQVVVDLNLASILLEQLLHQQVGLLHHHSLHHGGLTKPKTFEMFDTKCFLVPIELSICEHQTKILPFNRSCP